MFQRTQPERQRMSGTNVNSSFFVSHTPETSGGNVSTPGSSSYYRSNASQGNQQQYYGGPATATVGHYSDNMGKRGRRKGGAGGSGFSLVFVILWTAIVFVAVYGYISYTKEPTPAAPQHRHRLGNEDNSAEVRRLGNKLETLQKSYDDLEKSKNEWQKKAQSLTSEVENVRRGGGSQDRRELDETLQLLHQEQQFALDWKAKAVGLEESMQQLERRISHSARSQLLQKYGPGPHSVEIEFGFEAHGGGRGYVTLELASVDDMPHSVFTFLELVERGMYNNDAIRFHHNGAHISQGSATDSATLQKFMDTGIGHVLYQEYSPNFPHVAYTAGFSSRPSGPNFYFNTKDNSAVHGPGGYAADGSPDPCFGKVTRGFDVIDRIHGLTGALEAGAWREIQPPVPVLSMRRLA
eukprot:Nitzschia sp. Nitz4//scaffold297_size22919//11866//13169//NITZ4_008522-RA/size22919-augustus-gene-0.6-mRNA-1//1//CDS//3329546301//9152//frame0